MNTELLGFIGTLVFSGVIAYCLSTAVLWGKEVRRREEEERGRQEETATLLLPPGGLTVQIIETPTGATKEERNEDVQK